MALNRIDCGNGVHLSASFIFATSHDPGRVETKLFEVASRWNIGWVQLNRFLKFLLHFPCEGEAALAVCLSAIGSPEPLVVDGVFSIQRDGFFRLRGGIVIIPRLVIGSRQPVVSLSRSRHLRNNGLQSHGCADVVARIELTSRLPDLVCPVSLGSCGSWHCNSTQSENEK